MQTLLLGAAFIGKNAFEPFEPHLVIISVIGSFLAFSQFFILTQGGPGSQTTPIVLYIYQRAFVQLQVGAATAQSIVLVIVVALITALQFRLLREKD